MINSIGNIFNFVLQYMCNFHLYLHNTTLINVIIDIYVSKRATFPVLVFLYISKDSQIKDGNKCIRILEIVCKKRVNKSEIYFL